MAIHIQEYGDPDGACLMVFLHGGGVSGWMWEKQVAAFAGYHFLVPDLPGHGFSREDTEFTIRSSAEELLLLIEERAQGRKIVVTGFSLGAQVLVQMLGLRPEPDRLCHHQQRVSAAHSLRQQADRAGGQTVFSAD